MYAIIAALLSFAICYYAFLQLHGFWAIVLKSTVFTGLYGGAIIYFDLSPDVLPVWDSVIKKAGFGRNKNRD